MHVQGGEVAEFVQVSTHYCLWLLEFPLCCLKASLYIVPHYANSAISVFALMVARDFRYINLKLSVNVPESMVV